MTDRIIDAAAHPYPAHGDDIREFMSSPLNHLRFPGLDGYFYPPPENEFRTDTAAAGDLPGSDLALMQRHLFEDSGISAAVLLPLTRGVLPDLDMASEVCSGTNRWLAERWLSRDPRFFGSIRVNPADPARAIRELDEWAGHPQMVQVAIPLQAHQPYGQRLYRPLWERVAHHGLPVAVHADGMGGNEFWPTSIGYPTTYIEAAAQYPINYVVHLMSLIAEGTFEDLPGLKFVFADGGLDMLFPILWRFDADWRPLRSVTPWVKKTPIAYLAEQVRFCSQLLEGPTEAADVPGWLEEADAAHLLMYSSNYPSVAFQAPDAFADAPPSIRERVLAGNALDLYPRIATSALR